MAFSMNNGGGFGSRRQRGAGSLSEINVTPFVDVVLVLLVIFMLTASVMDFGLEVDVPKTRLVKDTAEVLPIISITKEGNLYLGDKEVQFSDLKLAIQGRFGVKTKGVYVMADKKTVYDPIAQVISELNVAGFQVLLVTQPIDTAASKGRK
jgi:biopolymer transport protein ExbD